ncbi:MAG TPA: DNA gyrase inhibitor YacG [Rhodospirillales bacterium]|nr:DNA gyrase inhibitor YacG [Rhodospirillales bacterium]
MTGDGTPPAPAPKRSCPICRRPAVDRFRPFCSKRCADIDLGRWFGEAYRIPAEDESDDETEAGDDDPNASH